MWMPAVLQELGRSRARRVWAVCVPGEQLSTEPWAGELPGVTGAGEPGQLSAVCAGSAAPAAGPSGNLDFLISLLLFQFSARGEKKQNKRRAPKVHHQSPTENSQGQVMANNPAALPEGSSGAGVCSQL